MEKLKKKGKCNSRHTHTHLWKLFTIGFYVSHLEEKFLRCENYYETVEVQFLER